MEEFFQDNSANYVSFDDYESMFFDETGKDANEYPDEFHEFEENTSDKEVYNHFCQGGAIGYDWLDEEIRPFLLQKGIVEDSPKWNVIMEWCKGYLVDQDWSDKLIFSTTEIYDEFKNKI